MKKKELRNKLYAESIPVYAGNKIKKRDIEKILASLDLEDDIVVADLKSVIKKVAKILFGAIIITETALGGQILAPDTAAKMATKAVQLHAENYHAKKEAYTVKLEDISKGGVQHVTFKFMRDGQVAAKVSFEGYTSGSYQQDKINYMTYDNCDLITAQTSLWWAQTIAKKTGTEFKTPTEIMVENLDLSQGSVPIK